MLPPVLDIATLAEAYRAGRLTPRAVVEAVIERIAASPDPAVWITLRSREDLLAAADALAAEAPAGRPLWGIPFAVKDNIDVAGLPTTAACPAFAYDPAVSAAVVDRLVAAGAIVVGKTNLDQFATGLVGTRSPYGAPRSVFDPATISGGSSSGSAVAVARGEVAFALGTDTAGSGRIPAAFNNLVGVKPTRGLLSTRGVVPACRNLDCVSVFAATTGDASLVRRVAEGFDPADAFSRAGAQRPLSERARIGVPRPGDLEFFGDGEAERLYAAAVARAAGLGHPIVEIDFAPFREAAAALYGGAWVAERLAAVEPFYRANAAAMDPTVATILGFGDRFTAADAWRAEYRMAELRRAAAATFAAVDALLLPTAPTTYTVAEIAAEPIALNARLGTYTNFVNLFDCAAIAVPAGFRADGLPFGVTLIAPAFTDDALAVLGDRLHRDGGDGPGRDRHGRLPAGTPLAAARPAEAAAARAQATPAAPAAEPRDVPTEPAAAAPVRLAVAVCGAHLAGEPLNGDLVALGGRLVRAAVTAADYRLYALAGAGPARPGLVRQPGFAGPGIAVEIWSLPADGFGRLVAAIPPPLGVGTLTLADGSAVSGFLCEPHGTAGARDITGYGGWRAFLAAGAALAAAASAAL